MYKEHGKKRPVEICFRSRYKYFPFYFYYLVSKVKLLFVESNIKKCVRSDIWSSRVQKDR